MNGTKQICVWAAIACCHGLATPSFAVNEFVDIDFQGIEVDRMTTNIGPVPAAFGKFHWSSTPLHPALDRDSESIQAFRFKLDVISDSVSEIWEFGPVLQYRIEPEKSRNRLAEGIYQPRFSSVAAGAYVGVSSGPWRANLTLATGGLSEGYQGYLTGLEGSYRLSPLRDLNLTLDANLSYSGAGYSEAYPGLSDEAQNAGRPLSNDDGLADWGLKLGADYSFSKHLGLFGAVTYDRQVSNPSSIRNQGEQRDDSQYGATLSISYQF